MKKQTRSAVFLAQGAMIAAIYTVLTLLAATMNLAYGPVNFGFLRRSPSCRCLLRQRSPV